MSVIMVYHRFVCALINCVMKSCEAVADAGARLNESGFMRTALGALAAAIVCLYVWSHYPESVS